MIDNRLWYYNAETNPVTESESRDGSWGMVKFVFHVRAIPSEVLTTFGAEFKNQNSEVATTCQEINVYSDALRKLHSFYCILAYAVTSQTKLVSLFSEKLDAKQRSQAQGTKIRLCVGTKHFESAKSLSMS